jgi:hypothetical protein
VKIAGDSEIHNFPIHHFVHTSSIFERKRAQSSLHRNGFCQSAPAPRRRTPRCAAPALRRARMPIASAFAPPRLPRPSRRPRCAISPGRTHLEAPRSLPRATRQPPSAPYHGRQRTAPPNGPTVAPLPPCAVPRWYLHCHPVVTGEHAYLKSIHSPSRVRHATTAPARSTAPPWPPPSKLPPLLFLLATAHKSIFLGTSSTSPGHALPWPCAPLARVEATTAAATWHHRAPPPVASPLQLRKQTSPR